MMQGKVRDIVDEGDTLLLITTDRLSAFDRFICTIPHKGMALNQLSAWWLKKTQHIVPNHFLECVADNSMRVKKCRVLPIEVVVRGYITGTTNTSLWTLYQAGERDFFGERLPDGLLKNQKLPKPILTPTSKSVEHDLPLQRDDIEKIPGLSPQLWQEITAAALKLFIFASEYLNERGLILADTKYEFGLDDENQLCLIDEVHTPDSSRYWSLSDWQHAISHHKDPNSYDKEIIRLWLREQCDPYTVEVIPKIPDELITTIKKRYEELYQQITARSLTCAE